MLQGGGAAGLGGERLGSQVAEETMSWQGSALRLTNVSGHGCRQRVPHVLIAHLLVPTEKE